MLEVTQPVADSWSTDPFGQLEVGRRDDAVDAVAGGGYAEPGWVELAMALRTVLASSTQSVVTLHMTGYSPLTVHAALHTYVWEHQLHDAPGIRAPGIRAPGIGAPSDIVISPATWWDSAQARNLDGLLWQLSRLAFPDRPAPWLQLGDLYRLQRWPNLTTINPELDDMRQTAMLSNGMFTIEELAGFSDRAYAPTRSLINALSLMNTLQVVAPRETAGLPPQQTKKAPAAPKLGIFQRLRSKLGL